MSDKSSNRIGSISACPHDRYGPTCGQSCSSQCKPQLHSEDRNCSQSNGACLLGCIIGWQGTNVTKVKAQLFISTLYFIFVNCIGKCINLCV